MWNIESMFRQRPFSRMSKIDDTSTSPFCKNIIFFLIASYRISLVSLSWKILAFQCQENHLISMQQVPQSILSHVSWSLLQMSNHKIEYITPQVQCTLWNLTKKRNLMELGIQHVHCPFPQLDISNPYLSAHFVSKALTWLVAGLWGS